VKNKGLRNFKTIRVDFFASFRFKAFSRWIFYVSNRSNFLFCKNLPAENQCMTVHDIKRVWCTLTCFYRYSVIQIIFCFLVARNRSLRVMLLKTVVTKYPGQM